MAKIRQSFVANSSSSSFIIVGKSFETYKEAEDEISKIQNDYLKMFNNEYVAGIDIATNNLEDGMKIRPQDLICKIQNAMLEYKKLTGAEPQYVYIKCGYN